MITCENCDTSVSDEHNFCPECGSELIDTPTDADTLDVDESNEKRSLTVTLVLAWCGGLVAVGLGLLFALITLLGGALLVIAGLLTIPKTRRRIERAAGVQLSQGLIAVIFVVGVVGGFGLAASQPVASAEYDVEEVKDEAETIPYDDLLRNIEDHEGKSIEYTGQVVQVMDQDNDRYVMRVAVTRDGVIWDDDIYVTWEGERILEDDIITLWGVVEGPLTYETVMGNERTIPKITAVDINVEESG